MRKFAIISASWLAVALAPTLGLADTVVVDPGVDAWVMEQPDADSVTIEGDVVVGTALPDDVKIVEVPDNDKFGYVVVGKKRMLVERDSRKVVKVY